jgi:hypothetical protein
VTEVRKEEVVLKMGMITVPLGGKFIFCREVVHSKLKSNILSFSLSNSIPYIRGEEVASVTALETLWRGSLMAIQEGLWSRHSSEKVL